MSLICFPLDNTDYDAAGVGVYMATRTRGVFSAGTNLATAAGTGMSVTVSPGIAWLKRSAYWGVAALSENNVTLPIEVADGVLSRLDVVVLRLDKVANKAEVAIKKGAFDTTPVIDDPVRDENSDELYLASVLVGPGVVSITAEDITDLRLDENYCGIMRDGVTGIPTEQLQEQAAAMIAGLKRSAATLIAELQSAIGGVLDGSEYMLKTAYAGNAAGVVKDSDKLGGQPPSYYGKAPLNLAATLTAVGWTGTAAPYTQEVALNGVLETDCPHVAPTYSTTLATAIAQQEAWAAVSMAEAGASKITFTCFEDKPTVDIPIQVEVLR